MLAGNARRWPRNASGASALWLVGVACQSGSSWSAGLGWSLIATLHSALRTAELYRIPLRQRRVLARNALTGNYIGAPMEAALSYGRMTGKQEGTGLHLVCRPPGGHGISSAMEVHPSSLRVHSQRA